MNLVLNNPVENIKEIDEAVNGLVNNSHKDDFREIGIWMVKTGLGEKGAREKLINELSTHIAGTEQRTCPGDDTGS